MNGHTNGRRNRTCSTRTYHVTPTTRAIRAALAITVTMVALGGSGLALAGTCTTDATTNTVSCDGDFTGLPGGNFTPVADLTLILGDSAPTSVTPAAGTVGVEASWGGNVGVITGADITTSGADGIHEYGSTSASLTNTGTITTNVTAPGAVAADISAYGDVTVVNNGTIDAYSTGANAVTALSAYSIHGAVSVDNQSAGTIAAIAQGGNAIALYSSSYGDDVVTNEGTITATSVGGVAVGAIALAYKGNATVTNSGSISATSTNYQAVGLIAASSSGEATVDNSGTVSATGGQDQAIGISASSALGSSVTNSGHVYATSTYGESAGIQAQSTSGTASITNTGTIVSKNSSQYLTAYGAIASSSGGQATITNYGTVQAINRIGAGVGLMAYSDTGAGSTINNSGYVLGGSYQGNATAILASAVTGDANVTNSASGYVRSVTLGTTTYKAIGISAQSASGNTSVINDGSVFAEGLHGSAVGIKASAGGTTYVGNAGSVEAVNGYYNNATGIQASSSNGAVTVVNTGSVYAASDPRQGTFTQKTTTDGILAVSNAGNSGPTAITTVANSGYVHAVGAWFVNGIAAGSYGGTSVTNAATGSIYVVGLDAEGIQVVETVNALSDYGHGTATVVNAGSIRVNQTGDCDCNNVNPFGEGIDVDSSFGGDINVSNSGSIAINTQHGAIGIYAYGTKGETTVDNSGSIAITAAATVGYLQRGIYAKSAYAGIAITNSGDISIVTAPVAGKLYIGPVSWGMYARAGREGSRRYQGSGDTVLVNTGQIDIDSHFGYGMSSWSQYGASKSYNSGTITVNDDFSSEGIAGFGGNPIVSGAGSILIDNSGSISATASNIAIGLFAQSRDFGYLPGIDATIDNSGYVLAASQVRAQGILAVMFHDDTVAIDNSGSIVANALLNDRIGQYAGFHANSVGIHSTDYFGSATVTNSGSITATTTENKQTPGAASGVFTQDGYNGYYQSSFGDTAINNTGSISASLVSSYATQASGVPQYAGQLAFGPSNTATGLLVANTYGNVTVSNAGTISASAKSDHYAGGGADNGSTYANGISVVSQVGAKGKAYSLGDIAITNASTGQIVAYSESSYASGDTAMANGISGRVVVGSDAAPLVSAGHGITIANAGIVSATAVNSNDPTGLATATGISAVNGSTAGYVNVTNSGSIAAAATSPGLATATGISASGYSVAATLDAGYVGATATGASGIATGVSLVNSGTAALAVANAGTIKATFAGAGGLAYGADITSAGDVNFTNSGQILATNVGNAVGVQLNSATSNTLVNSGLISAASSAGNSIAIQTGAVNDTFQNTGTINGAIVTGAGNDTLTNSVGGVWNAIGTSTDFGSGDDTVTNAGTINLNNSAITLGSGGNAFSNSGMVTALGANTIDVGAGNVFTNTGSVEMRNGTAGDALTVNGNWAGSGQLGLDVSPLHNTSDMLHVVGNVAAGSVTAVNVNLLNLPTTATSSVPVVDVTGDSAAGNFVLGDVHFDTAKSFLVVQAVDLTSAIDTSNATPDVFSVGVAVTGVTDSGALAASIVPGVESLMNSEVGTWRQRMGVLVPTAQGSVGLWARAFDDSGTVNPGHIAGNFGQGGNFSFDQTNSGQEIGADFGIAPNLSAGLMLGKANANQHLDGGGVGRNRISGDTRGAYLTWMAAGGLYLDASYRTMSFDARLDSQAGESRTTGNADAFNIELGQSWSFGEGFKLVPQVQYTRTTVDKADTLTGALAGFTPQGGDSSRGRAGLTLSDDIPSGNAIWTPYVSASAVHEFDGQNDFVIDDTFTGTTDTKGTSALVEGGVSVKTGKLEVFAGVNWQDGGALKSFAGGQVGLRYNW
jgi:outer membrane autotransporter protein